MKTYVLSVMMNILVVIILSARIKNGYEPDINTAREGLKKLNALLLTDTTLSSHEKNKIKGNVSMLTDFIMYHELTERLLLQFKMIAPDIYNEIDTIRDAKKRSVDVYVKFLPRESMRGSVAGSTNIPTEEGEDAYNSKYGLHTASVLIVTGKDALILLAHEFGHVQYQVPNIAAYRKFYTKHYLIKTDDSEGIGHHHMDPCGQKAFEFGSRFRSNYSDFLRIKNNKVESPIALIEEISENLQ